MIEKLKKLDVGFGCILTCLYFAALPLTITRNSAGSSFLKVLTIPIAGYLLVSMVFYKGKLKLNSVHFFSMLFLMSTVVTLFVDRSAESVAYVRGYTETMALLFLITAKEYSKNEIEAIEITQLILLVILIWLGFLGADWYGSRNTMTLFGATCDPNYFAGLFLLPIAVALKKLREKKVYMVICPVLIGLGSYIVLSSGSRGGLLALIVTVLAYVFISARDMKQRLIGLIAAIILAVLLWTVVIPLLPESVSSRFSVSDVIESRGSSRVDIWVSMLTAIKNSTWELICGRGINSYHWMMKEGKMVQVVAHNQFIQSLYNQGILGCASFCLMSGAAILRNIKKRAYISAAMLGTLALAMSLSINPSIKEFWNLLIYSAFVFETTNKSKEVDSI